VKELERAQWQRSVSSEALRIWERTGAARASKTAIALKGLRFKFLKSRFFARRALRRRALKVKRLRATLFKIWRISSRSFAGAIVR